MFADGKHAGVSLRRLARALLPAASLAAVLVTCENPTSVGRAGSIAAVPRFSASGLATLAGMPVDSVRATIIRPPDQVLLLRTLPFSPDSGTVSANLSVTINGAHERLLLRLDLLAGGTVMFTGQDSVDVVPGVSTEAAQIAMAFVGPGMNVASLHVSPRDSGAAFGTTAQLTVTALDSSAAPVPLFYAAWSTSSTTDTVNAAGAFHAGSARGWAWVRATTPTGIRDSVRILVAPPASAVQATAGSGQSAIAHTTLPQPLVARVVAADNGPVAGVQVTFTAPSGGSVSPASGVSDTLGYVATTATLGTAIGPQTFTATVSGLTAATFAETGTAGAAVKLAFTTQPSSVAAGAAITPAVRVTAQDSAGNTAASFTGNVTLALGANPGGATLGGTLTAAAAAGIATFSNLSLDKAASGYTLVAQTPTIGQPDTSAAFTVTAGPAVVLTYVSGDSQTGAPNAQLAAPVVVRVSDAFGNPVAGHPVAFAVTAGGGSAGTPSATTSVSGQASSTWTMGASGPQTLSISASGLVGQLVNSPITVHATVTGVASTSVTPHLDTLTSLGDTVRLTAQAKDFQNNPVAGTFTWSSADTSIATVSALGTVTAVKNGSVLVTAHEAGGTQDTARIVVQQRVATVNVTPGNRSIYLTRTFQFSASAVDGRGHPIAGFGPYAWSSTAPAVASVDSTGFVTGTGLGNAQIKATAGTITGVANVAVLTPITRIVVEVAGGPGTTDTFTMPSLGLTRTYQAIAHDTLDAVMSGVTFTWQSTNPSVASLDSMTATTARATAQANGYTAIQASAQGVTSAPGASLTVAQVLASIVLSGPPANPGDTIAVGGTISLTARGKDANGFFIPGGTFRFVSSNPSVATVDSVTGLVTGVGVGNDTITASSGAITSNVLQIVVNNAGPAIISFGRDTLSVGRGSSTSIPVLLSRPYASPLIVKLANPAAYAHWQGAANGFATVTIPAGQTSANATLVGDSAGTTTVTATDSTGAGYTAASATLKVTANMRLTSTSYYVNTTDHVTTQVLLSDPSPAGGTYVTFSYGTPGVASVSPSPAYIPAGQLAADIQITGTGPGTTSITPVATGVNGQASSFQAYPPNLTMSTTLIRLGVGQYEPNVYVYLPTNDNNPVPVTLGNTDTTVAVTPPAVTIPSGSNYAYFTTQAIALGTVTITPSSPGWTAQNTLTVQSTTPHIAICCGTTLNTTNPAVNVTVYTEDSTLSAHNRSNSLVVHLQSSNDSIMHVIDTVVTVQPGAYYNNSARVIPGGTATGTAYIIASAPGHTPDSTAYTTIGPKLNFSFGTIYLGAGQYEPNGYVYTPNNVLSPLLVSVANSDTNVAGVPAVDTIPTGSNYRYFTTLGKAPGTVTLTATAPGYQPDTNYVVVTTPRITACCSPTLNNFSAGTNFTVYATDSMRNAHNLSAPVAVSVQVLDPGIIAVDSSAVTIPAGTYYNNHAHITPLAVGTGRIVFSAPGYLSTDTIFVTVVTPKLNLSFYSAQIGRRQHFDAANNGFYVYTPDARNVSVPVTIGHNGTIDSLTAAAPFSIDSGTNYKYFDAYGQVNGLDTIIVSAAGYVPDTAYLTVSSPRLTNCCMPGSATTTNPPFGMTVYTADSSGNAHWSVDSLTVYAVSSDTTVIRPSHPKFRFPAGRYYLNDTNLTVQIVGPGTASITYSDSSGLYAPTTTGTITVTGPSLSLSNAAQMLGMRQNDGNQSYVYIPNATANPLVVHLLSTATSVATVPDSVIIPANSNYVYFTVTARDTIGTIQIQATATGYNSTSMNVQVTHPRFTISTATSVRTTSGRLGFTVYATDQNGGTHYVTDTVVVHLASSQPGVATFDSNTVTILPGQYYNNTAGWYPNSNQATPGTAQLSATDTTAAFYQYGAGTANVQVVTPALYMSWGTSYLGIGQYFEPYVSRPDNALEVDTVPFTHTGTPHVTTAQYQANTPVSSVTIPAGTNYSYFRVIGLSKGTDTLTASLTTPPHSPVTAYTVVDTGRISVSGWPATLAVGDSTLLTLYSADQNNSGHNVADSTTFTLAPSSGLVFVPYQGSGATTSATIVPGGYYVYVWLRAVASGTGSVQISNNSYITYTNTVTVP